MITLKNKEEVLKDIEEHLTPWDQKEVADKLVSKYVDLNEYIDDNPYELDICDVIDDYVQRESTEELLDMINDCYGIARYVANDKYMTEYMLDEFHTKPCDFVDSLKRSRLTITEILDEAKEDEDLYEEIKKFVIEKCIDENVTVHDLISKKDSIFKNY